jgi:hypothetical protein
VEPSFPACDCLDGTLKRARTSFKELRGFALLFVLVGLVGGIGLMVYGFTDIERTSAVGTGLVLLVAGLWAATIARAASVVVELLLELLLTRQEH